MSTDALIQAPIGDFVEPVLKWNPKKDCQQDTFRYIDVSSIDQKNKTIVFNGEIPVKDAPSRARQLLKGGDILVSTVRPNLNSVAFVSMDLEGATGSTGFCVLRPDSARLDGRYLFHWVQTPQFIADMTNKATGQSYPAISDRIVKESLIPLPSIDEQRRIAAVLDRAYALRHLRRRSIERINELGKSIFYETFGDPKTNPKQWTLRVIGDLASNEDGWRIPLKKSDRETRDGPYPYYGASGIIDYIDDFIFEGRRLLVGEDGANLVARSTPIAFIADGKFWVNNHAHVLAENGEAVLEYLRFTIEALDLKPYLSGTAQPKLNQRQLNNIMIPSPPLKMQKEFVYQLIRINKLVKFATTYQENNQSLHLSLQKRAFCGEL